MEVLHRDVLWDMLSYIPENIFIIESASSRLRQKIR